MLSNISFTLTQNNQAFALVGSYGSCNIGFDGDFGGGKIVAYTGRYEKVISFTADVTPLKISNANIDLTKLPNGRRGLYRFAENTPAYNKFKFPFVKTETDPINPTTDFTPKEQFSEKLLKYVNFIQPGATIEFFSPDCVSPLQITNLKPSYKAISTTDTASQNAIDVNTAQYLVDFQSFDEVTYYRLEGAVNPNVNITLHKINETHYLTIL